MQGKIAFGLPQHLNEIFLNLITARDDLLS